MSILNHAWRSERRRCWLALVAIAFLPFTVTTAHAADGAAVTAPRGDVERAKSQLAIGQQAYDEARHEDALVAFEAAYAAYPIADFQYNIGLCHERLGHVDAAIRAFEAYLVGKPDAQDRSTVERRIEVLLEKRPVAPTAVVASVPPPAPRPISDGDLIDPFPSRSDTTSKKGERRAKRMVAGGAITFALGVGVGVGGGVGFAMSDSLPLQIASIAAGGVMVGTGIGLMAAGKRRQRRANGHAWLSPTPTGIAVAGRF